MTRFVPVWKARKPPPGKGGEEFRALHAASDGTSPTFSVNFVDATQTVADEITPELVMKLIERGALDDIINQSIDWQYLELLLTKGLKPDIIQTIKAAADAANSYTTSTIKDALGITPDLTFNMTNPRLVRWVNVHTAELVRQATAESQDAIRTIIGRALTDELSPSETFASIRRSIGLTDRMAAAAQNVYMRGINDGLDPSEAALESDTYAQRALTYRANMIARTETMMASNQGQSEGWDQAADQGYFDRNDAEVEWFTVPDDRRCPTCAAMHGVRRPFNGVWTVTIYDNKGRAKGTVDIDNPSFIHPMCRCVGKLILGGG